LGYAGTGLGAGITMGTVAEGEINVPYFSAARNIIPLSCVIQRGITSPDFHITG